MWKAGGSRAAYNSAKRVSNCAVYHAKSEAKKIALQKIDPKFADVYRLAKQMRRDYQDVMGEKPVKNHEGLLSLDEDAKKEAWKECVVEGLIRQRVEIDEMQCGFMSSRGTTDAIFIVHQLQEKHLAANKLLDMAFVDLEKAFDWVPGDVI